MKRKVTLLFKIFISTIRLFLTSLLSFGRVQWKFPVSISLKSKLQVNNKGKIGLGYRSEIEEYTNICSRSGKVTINNHVYINRNGTIICHEGITIGEGTTIGPNIVIYDHDHDFRSSERGKFKSAPIVIGKNVWIGANVTILKGVTVGDNAVIGAGCIITKDIPESVIVSMQNNLRVVEIKQ
ncbi:acyltransferase [Mesobacillus maritimus]|uniref:acyltransferase n=1 Tax=Mesobacillus maritimus TaxID=1643336 RepID=UPI00203FFFD5|nr:acyltransferase [Mesobacillus maritimus]MCM3670896.1 acyltransferase [Mesobacillus maritimus]